MASSEWARLTSPAIAGEVEKYRRDFSGEGKGLRHYFPSPDLQVQIDLSRKRERLGSPFIPRQHQRRHADGAFAHREHLCSRFAAFAEFGDVNSRRCDASTRSSRIRHAPGEAAEFVGCVADRMFEVGADLDDGI